MASAWVEVGQTYRADVTVWVGKTDNAARRGYRRSAGEADPEEQWHKVPYGEADDHVQLSGMAAPS